MENNTDRRQFLGAAGAAFTIVPRHVLGLGFVPPSDKVTVAHIGMGTQSFNELGPLLSNSAIQIVAVCDPNRESSDYVEWGRNSVRDRIRRLLGDSTWRENTPGCPGGREIGRQVIDAYYTRERGAEKFRGVTAYVDFRELLEKEKGIDVVKVMTPDHLHAAISIAAMKKRIGVLVHKPLSNVMYESRLVIETARKTGVMTHFLPYASGGGNRFLISQINKGAIGNLKEVHCWSNRPMWPQYIAKPTDKPAVPEGFDWDLWLGPEQDRPYHPHYTHAVFRGWYDFGGGPIADMGIYSLWPVLTGLDLSSPVSADPWTTHHCVVEENVAKRIKNDYSFPTASTIRFKFAARGTRPGVELFWYDGGMRPRLPEELDAEGKDLGIEGIMFVGDQGKIIAGFTGQNPQIYPKTRSEYLEGQPPPRQRGEEGERRELWLDAVRGGPASPGSFLNASAISDLVNLGAVALRTGKKLQFDPASMTITNVPEANRYLRRQYRQGWEL